MLPEQRRLTARGVSLTQTAVCTRTDQDAHGDHAYGNMVFAKEGASIIAQAICARLLKIDGPKVWEDASKGPAGRKDLRESKLKQPNLVFDDKLVLDDGKQRIEFYFFGHAH